MNKRIIHWILAVIFTLTLTYFIVITLFQFDKHVYNQKNHENEMYIREVLGSTYKNYLIDNSRPLLVSELGPTKLFNEEFKNKYTYEKFVNYFKKISKKKWVIYYNKDFLDNYSQEKIFNITIAKNIKNIKQKIEPLVGSFSSQQGTLSNFEFNNKECSKKFTDHYYEFSQKRKYTEIANCLNLEPPNGKTIAEEYFRIANDNNRIIAQNLQSRININDNKDFYKIKFNVELKEVPYKEYGILRYFAYITGSRSDYIAIEKGKIKQYLQKNIKIIKRLKPKIREEIYSMLEYNN